MSLPDWSETFSSNLKGIKLDTGNILPIVIGVILLIAIVLLLGSGMAMGGMVMMAGMMSTPIGWVALLIILAVGGFLAYAAFFAH